MNSRYVAWPPPGLERLQGAVGPITRGLGVGALLISIPLLWSIGTDAHYYSFGPFGRNWWLLSILGTIGLITALVALAKLFIMLRIAFAGTRLGHGLLTLAHVVSDTSRDTGFLLQGARIFAGMEEPGRRGLLLIRLLKSGAILGGVLWLTFGLFIAVLLAVRAAVPPNTLWVIEFAPAGALFLIGGYLRLREMMVVHAARKQSGSVAREELAGQAATWGTAYDALASGGVFARGIPHRKRPVAVTAAALGVLTLVFFLSITGVLLLSATGPLVADVSIPRYSGIQEKALPAEAMRPYRLPFDASITPLEAGESIHVLAVRDQDLEWMKPSVRTYERWWERNLSGQRVARSWEAAAHGRLSAADREYFARYANLPAAREFSLLGRAEHADIVTATWKQPFPSGMDSYDLPIPRLQRFSDGAKSQMTSPPPGQRMESQSAIQEMARLAADPSAMRGLRWEFVRLVSGYTSCINLHRAVYGPGADFEEWLEGARSSLVRYPSEQPLFSLMSQTSNLPRKDLRAKGILWKTYTFVLRAMGFPEACGVLATRG